MTDETRRAQAQWHLQDASGATLGDGVGEALIDDDRLAVGSVSAAFLDVDALHVGSHRIELGLWPSGRLALSGLGRRFDTFLRTLRGARNRARVAGLLAHAPTRPEVFDGALLESRSAEPVELQVFSTHIVVVPESADPWQIPLGALDEATLTDDPLALSLASGEQRTLIGRLGRRRDALHACVLEARAAQAQLLERYTGRRGFADGVGLPRSAVSGFEALLAHCCAPARLEGARQLLAAATVLEPCIGFVQLLDPDAETLQARMELPAHWASFLLVPVNDRVALEMLAGPGAATYVFAGDVREVNRDLQLLHFRRAALALSEEAAAITPENPYRLALRKLAPLQRLRARTRARVIHDEGWEAAVREALLRARG